MSTRKELTELLRSVLHFADLKAMKMCKSCKPIHTESVVNDTITLHFHIGVMANQIPTFCIGRNDIGEIIKLKILRGEISLIQNDLWLREDIKIKEENEMWEFIEREITIDRLIVFLNEVLIELI